MEQCLRCFAMEWQRRSGVWKNSGLCGTACGYGDILDRKVPVPTPEIIAKSMDKKALQQAEETVKVNTNEEIDR